MPNDDLRVAIYARVSGEQQAKDDTIASQLEAVTQRVASDALECEPELCFLDDGYSGDILARPGLERLRDQAAAGVIDRLYVLDPDRFSRKYAYQVLILEELTRCGVELVQKPIQFYHLIFVSIHRGPTRLVHSDRPTLTRKSLQIRRIRLWSHADRGRRGCAGSLAEVTEVHFIRVVV